MSREDSVAKTASERLQMVRDAIGVAAREAGRSPDAVTLVAVSKTHDAAAVVELLGCGHRVFGENRVQEAQGKFPDLKVSYADLELHLIGPLQTNKAGDAVALFDVIQTVDRPKLARSLAKEMDKQGRRPRCFIQVNTGEEAQKGGVLPADLEALVTLARDLDLPLEGLMCIPPVEEDPAIHFAFLRELARRHGLSELSMGMSGDFDVAVTFGATFVRVGTALFGARDYSQQG
ncbi:MULTISPECIES: YggS family pyridoxal phosphate-dependent enzyme [Limibacillus]|jgi:pyridoxal phosphate enzyme (YggS family)|uniref:Pyridoxal phosphate homeostasis protein n=1 Tax=Limibacillus halophilus TaxID=1579333 RepID=A0A839SP04_9PROT|nr:YggS family pyridoxal phosphate-dependent enzyme [Limibacillus halophilus]MBB3063918.1 hypothetical protein [Limibacillus halophilus]